MGLRDTALHIVGQVDGVLAYAGEDVVRINKELGGLLVDPDFDLLQGTDLSKFKYDVYEKKTLSIAAATVSAFLFMCPPGQRWVLHDVLEYHQTGSTSGTMNLTVDTGTTAPGAGTAQLSATISLAAATQQVVQQGSLIATPTVMGPGSRLSILIAGTMTSLANGIVVYRLKRVF